MTENQFIHYLITINQITDDNMAKNSDPKKTRKARPPSQKTNKTMNPNDPFPWGEKKTFLVRSIARKAAMMGKIAPELSRKLNRDKRNHLFSPIPPAGIWLRYYDPYALYGEFISSVVKIEGSSDLESRQIRYLIWKITHPNTSEIEKCFEDCKDIDLNTLLGEFTPLLSDIEKEDNQQFQEIIKGEDNNEHTKEQEAEIMSLTSLRFMMEVAIPCMQHYSVLPSDLFAHAQEGSIDAICDLLKIDITIIKDDLIGDHIINLKRNNHARFKQTIGKAMTSKLPTLSQKDSQINFMLIPQLIFEPLKKSYMKIISTDHQNIFDILTKSMTNNRLLRDPCLPDNNETLRKDIQRKAKKARARKPNRDKKS